MSNSIVLTKVTKDHYKVKVIGEVDFSFDRATLSNLMSMLSSRVDPPPLERFEGSDETIEVDEKELCF